MVLPPSLTISSSILLHMECTRFLKCWLSYIFWVQNLTFFVWQLELVPCGAERHTSLPQLNGCPFYFIAVVFGGGLDNQRQNNTELAQCDSVWSLINGVETTNFNIGIKFGTVQSEDLRDLMPPKPSLQNFF